MAVNPRAIAKALPPANRPAGSTSGYGQVPATMGGTPGLVASYDQWTSGRPYGPMLPRDPAAFLQAVTFSPSEPIAPVGINAPDPESGRPEPRRFEYPVSWNLPREPGGEGLKLASFGQLRTIADAYSVARSCIRVRIQEILGLDWEIVPTDSAEKKMRGDHTARREWEERKAAVVKFWKRPDPGKYHNFKSWLNAVLEDVFVVDALSLYMQPTRARGKGPLGSNIGALCHIAGDTVRPLLDALGGVPAPPNPAYQVYDYGVPRVDLMTALTGDDVEEMGEALAAEYAGDQLLYLPYHSRAWTPYGFPPLEQSLVPVLTGIAKQQFQLSYFDEGTIPGVFISAGDPNATPQQLRELQDALNAMAGDPAWRHKIIVLPQGAKIDPMRPAQLADQFDEIVMTQVCMGFDIQPMEMGIMPKVSTTASHGAANQMAKASEDINKRKSLRPFLGWLKDSIFDYVTQVCIGATDMQWKWPSLEEGEDEASREALISDQVAKGLMSIDEGRVELGRQPWGLPMTSDPVYFTATGIVPIGSINPDTGRPAGLEPAIVPGQPVGGQPPAGGPPTATGGNPPAAGGSGTGTGATTPAHTAATAATAAPAGAGTAAAKPAKAKPSSGGGTAKPTKPAKGGKKKAPATNKFAALRELDLLRRRLHKGQGVTGWVPEAIPADVFAGLTADVTAGTAPDVAIDKARTAVKVTTRRERRDQAVEGAQRQVVIGLAGLARGVLTGAHPTAGFVDQAVEVMRTGMTSGLRAGARHALADRGVSTRIVKAADDGGDDAEEGDQADNPDAYDTFLGTVADRISGEQRHYLEGLLQDLLAAGTIDAVANMAGRFGAYAGQVVSAYEEGYGLTTLATVDDPAVYTITWHTTSARPCAMCKDRDGKTYTVHSLPGWPGDGSFGGLCEGGPNCKCVLEYSDSAGRQSWGSNTLQGHPILAENRDLAAAQQQRLADAAAAREAFVDSLPDGPQRRARLRDEARNAIAAEQGVWPQDVDAKDVARRLFGTSTPTMEQRRNLGKHDGRDHGGEGHADATHEVYAYLARHYPASVLGWVKDAHWHGPMKVRLKDIDMARRPGGARNEPQVEAITADIEAGKKLDPVVLVDTPGGGKLQIADGWHRTDAAQHAGKSKVRAWVGTVDSDHGPWGAAMNEAKLNKAAQGDRAVCPCGTPVVYDDLDGWQHADGSVSHDDGESVADKMRGKVSKRSVDYRTADQSGRRCGACSMYRDRSCTLVAGAISPGDVCDRWEQADRVKSAGPVAAGLCVQAADTGRVLMLQRAISEDDPAAGKWEFPGGHIEPGESALDGALREWSEETGCRVPKGNVTGAWSSRNGVYTGLVWVVASEADVPIHDGRDAVTNPDDPDGDAIEALAWWDPALLPGNPAVRAELAADLAAVMQALSPQPVRSTS